jgi:DNA mismatch endonuclease (patch repair protein)
MLDALEVEYETHVGDLPGRPDFVLRKHSLCVFVDGDFWHGWRFNTWRLKLSEHWEEKISNNRLRDARNHRRLRRMGWRVLRLWEHQVTRTPEKCVARIATRILDPCPLPPTPATVGKGKRKAKD